MPKTVIRAGSGIFYDRFALANTVTALRYNGRVQQQHIFFILTSFRLCPQLRRWEQRFRAVVFRKSVRGCGRLM